MPRQRLRHWLTWNDMHERISLRPVSGLQRDYAISLSLTRSHKYTMRPFIRHTPWSQTKDRWGFSSSPFFFFFFSFSHYRWNSPAKPIVKSALEHWFAYQEMHTAGETACSPSALKATPYHICSVGNLKGYTSPGVFSIKAICAHSYTQNRRDHKPCLDCSGTFVGKKNDSCSKCVQYISNKWINNLNLCFFQFHKNIKFVFD